MPPVRLDEALALITDKLTDWFKALIALLPNLVLAAIVVVLGFYGARIIRRVMLQLMRRVSRTESLNQLASSIVYVVVLGVVLFTGLSILRLDKAVTSLLAGAGIIGLALAFAFQDIAANFISGVFLSFRRPIRVGDIVRTNELLGVVEEVNLRDTVLHTFQGQHIIIPNKEVFQNIIENFSNTNRRRVDLTVGISYDADLRQVEQIAREAARQVSVRDTREDVTFFYTEFADSSINFELRFWLQGTDQPTFLRGRHEAIILLKEAFDRAGITIPFPIRTLDFSLLSPAEREAVRLPD
jgi:small conductance mechanosensitive channel